MKEQRIQDKRMVSIVPDNVNYPIKKLRKCATPVKRLKFGQEIIAGQRRKFEDGIYIFIQGYDYYVKESFLVRKVELN